jgi:hypothetical protein
MSDEFTPLDPDEGPTVWARQLENNRYTVEIVEGTDPTDGLRSIELSHNEIKRLNDFIQS